jgi:quinolinate synthase
MASTSAVPAARPPASTPSSAPFPSLVIRADGFAPQGAFAEAQAIYLQPDPAAVARLDAGLRRHELGVVAHFYMDAELQGALRGCNWPHVHVADSLQMADRAVKMAAAGVKAIAVLGVDFMSENVRATLDASGFAHLPVYRAAEAAIGCSLAESAEARAYGAYLLRAARTPHSLHVIYVNTSLRTKALAQTVLPTITCTSSNVLPLLLQAFAQLPNLQVWFGPDTYMGRNLHDILSAFSRMDTATIRKLHPEHTPQSLRAAVACFGYFEQGVCVVHHMFGDAVVAQVKRDYPDAFVTAHLEVPGEMFALGFQAQQRGRGVVGSTSNILDFIGAQVARAVADKRPAHLRFILGTESGMITSIARQVQQQLRQARDAAGGEIAVEIVFPVAAQAIAATDDIHLPIVPGVAAGEGCSTAGGCASCPYMKMSSLDALMGLIDLLDDGQPGALLAYAPRTYAESIAGVAIAELGGKSIARMRAFQQNGTLPPELVAEVRDFTGEQHEPDNGRS